MIIRCSLVHRSILRSSRTNFYCIFPSHSNHRKSVKHYSASSYRNKYSYHYCCVPHECSNVIGRGSISLSVHPASTASLFSSPENMRRVFNSIGCKIKSLRIPRPPLGPLGGILGQLRGTMGHIFRQEPGSISLLAILSMSTAEFLAPCNIYAALRQLSSSVSPKLSPTACLPAYGCYLHACLTAAVTSKSPELITDTHNVLEPSILDMADSGERAQDCCGRLPRISRRQRGTTCG